MCCGCAADQPRAPVRQHLLLLDVAGFVNLEWNNAFMFYDCLALMLLSFIEIVSLFLYAIFRCVRYDHSERFGVKGKSSE